LVKRRCFLLTPLALLAFPASAGDYALVRAGAPLAFPRDHGSHPLFRTEWWYITGWLTDEAGREFGVQVTFFRNRPRVAEDSPSRLAARQLLFAHAAVADPESGRLQHDQRIARAGLDLAEAREGDMAVWIDDWSLRRDGDAIVARIAARDFALALGFSQTQPLLLQGEGARGISRKGPRPAQASFYYSLPQLAVQGTVTRGGKTRKVTGKAWLDHEWSSDYLAAEAAGWDWAGLNFADGSALMLFRIRGRDGGVSGGNYWAGGTLRRADGSRRVFAPADISFTPLRVWKSAASGASYPVAMRLRAGDLAFDIEPLFDDQELDSRASTGTIYWEGAVRAMQGGRELGRGYLELTGYWKALKL
jgi:predicted secreted hydrolase